jgi:hypothetical protein
MSFDFRTRALKLVASRTTTSLPPELLEPDFLLPELLLSFGFDLPLFLSLIF